MYVFFYIFLDRWEPKYVCIELGIILSFSWSNIITTGHLKNIYLLLVLWTLSMVFMTPLIKLELMYSYLNLENLSVDFVWFCKCLIISIRVFLRGSKAGVGLIWSGQWQHAFLKRVLLFSLFDGALPGRSASSSYTSKQCYVGWDTDIDDRSTESGLWKCSLESPPR